MALRTFNPATGKWEVVATSQAVEVKVVDLEDNFESNNVEGCLRELKGIGNENLSKIEELLSDFADHVLNHPGGSGPGGPGGGGGTDIYVSVTTKMNTNILASITSQVIVEFDYDSSVKKDGTATITVNSILKNTRKVSIGSNSIDVTSFIEKGNNEVVIEVANAYGIKDSVIFNIDVVDLELTSSFNYTTAFTDTIAFPYAIKGSVPKVIHFVMDGKEIHNEPIRSTNTIQKVHTIPKQTHGVHKLQVYATSSLGDSELKSNVLDFEVLCTESENNTVLISSQFNITEIDQYSMLSIPFIVFDPNSLTSDVELKINNKVVSSLKVNRDEQRWTLTNYPAGNTTFTIQSGEVKRDFVVNVNEVTIDVTEETNGLELYLSSNGRNNSDVNRDVWEYKGIESHFKNFNWVSDGWLPDEKGFTALTVGGDSCVEILFKPFEQDCRTLGKTIEIEFEVFDSIDYEATVISCMNNNRGFEIGCRGAVIKSNETSTKTLFKDGERLRVSFCIEPSSSNRIIYTYIDGVVSGLTQYSASDMFTHQQPATITIGSNKCMTRIYNIRIYNNCLSSTSVLNNFIYDKDDINSKIESYNKNNIYDSYGQIVYSRILNQIPCMTVTGTLPETKGDLKTVSIKFENKEDSSKNIVDPSVTMDVQGTSSQYFPRKNYTLTFNNPYQLRDTSIAVNTFCIKADFMESSHAHNTGLAKLINGLYSEKVPPQTENSRVRTTVDGYPIAVFYKETDSSPLKFYGIYNFNNDKSTHQVFGYGANTECWEICNNTSQRVLFNESDYSSEEWQKDFQSRYPAKNTDYTSLKRLTDWLVSVKDDPSRFKEDFRQYFNQHYTFMYYLLTELFGMVDSRAKNMFLASWDKKVWYPVFYDMDTVLGLNNEGVLEFGYNIEYHDVIGNLNVYNGEKSSLWNNVELSFEEEIGALYRDLRNNGILTYEKVLNILLDEQISKICEAQYNEDAKHKYLDPLTEKNISTFLYASQGSRTNHLKYWLYNRINYMDSKYLSSAYKDNYITLRLYTPSEYTGVEPNANFKLTPYADQYVRVKYGSYEKFSRSKADVETLIEAPNIVFNDTETIIYGANRLSDIGDLSDKYAGTVDVSKATQLGELIIGSDKEGYTNSNLRELSLGNNRLLRKLNINNCIHLSQPLDVSGCSSIEEIHAKGTAITSIMLSESSGNLKLLYLPGSITNLTVINKPKLQILTCESYDNINILRLENAGINTLTIFNNCKNVEYVRLMNIYDKTGYVTLNKLMKVKGMDENGKPIPIGQAVSGKITIASTSQHMLETYKQAFPYVEFTVTEFSKAYNVTFKDGDGNVIYVDNVIENGEAVYIGDVPKKTSTNQYDYVWVGWDRQLKPIISETEINATFNGLLRSHRIRFIDRESGEILSEQVVPYGTMPEIPPFPAKYNYWGRIVEPVTEPTDYVAEYVPLPEDYSIFSFTDNADGTLSCTLRSVANLPSQVIVPFMRENKYVTALKGENNVTGKANITEMYIPNTIKKWGGYIYTGCDKLTFERSSFPKTFPANNSTDYLCYKWGGATHIDFPEGAGGIGSYCFAYCTNLKSVNIPETVTGIYCACFERCTSLTQLDLPKSIHSITDQWIFSGCGIKCLNAPGVTKYTASNAFSGVSGCFISLGSKEHPVTICYADRIGGSAKTIFLTTKNGNRDDLIEGNTNNAEILYYPFDTKCVYTGKEIYTELNDGDNDKAIMCAIVDKASITEYNLKDIGGRGRRAYQRIVNHCFQNCNNLTEIDIPEGITELGTACFEYCGKLKSINLANSVSKIDTWCFRGSGLTSIDTNRVTTVAESCLREMPNLEYINMPCVRVLPHTVLTSSNNIKFISIGSKAYPVSSISNSNNTLGTRCCIVTTPRGTSDDVEFNTSFSLDNFYFTTMDSKWVKTTKEIYAELNDGEVKDKAIMGECLDKKITTYDLNDIAGTGRHAHGKLVRNCFQNCSTLTRIEIPEGVTSIGHYCFEFCSKMTSIELSDTVTTLQSWCFRSSGLTSLECKNVSQLGEYCLRDMPNLEYINMPCVTSIPNNVLYSVNNLKFISIGSKEHPVTYLSNSNNNLGNRYCIVTTERGSSEDVEFNTAFSLNDFHFTTMDSKWVKTTKEIYAELNDGEVKDKAIMGECLDKKITDYDLTNVAGTGRHACAKLVRNCFQNCNALTRIKIPEGVTIIGEYCFEYCNKMTNIELSDTVTALKAWCFRSTGLLSLDCKNVSEIGEWFIREMPNLEYINMPCVTSIPNNVLYSVNNLKFISIGSKEHPVTYLSNSNNNLGSKCCIVTTANGESSDVEFNTSFSLDNFYFTTMDSKWVKTTKEIYAELNDGEVKDKAIMGECLDKKITDYDLTNVAGTGRHAHDIIVQLCFRDFPNLTTITIPGDVRTVKWDAFRGCGALTSVVISDGVERLEDRAFYGCGRLSSMNFPESVSWLGLECIQGTVLRQLYCPGVTGVGNRCFAINDIDYISLPKLTNIPANILPNYAKFLSFGSKEYPVKSIIKDGNSLDPRCCIVTTETGSSDDVETNAEISFYNYYFTTMDSKWIKTTKEIYAELNDGNTRDKAIMGECLDKTITEYNLNDVAGTGRRAYEILPLQCFKNCNKLKSINIIGDIRRVQWDCFRDCSLLVNVTISDGVKVIGDYCFHSCGKLTSVLLGESVKEIGKGCFTNCYDLQIVEAPGVTTIGYQTFHNMWNIIYMNFPKLTRVPDNAMYCTSRFITFGSKEHPVEFIGEGNTYGNTRCCIVTTSDGTRNSADIKVDPPNFYFTTMDSKWVKTTKEIYAELNDGNTRDKAIMGECLDKKIKTYDLNDIAGTGRHACGKLSGYCFKSCTLLKTIEIPSSINALGVECFADCGALTEVNIGDSVEKLEDLCFRTCRKLLHISLPESTVSIGRTCFEWCDSLKTLEGPGVTSVGTTFLCGCYSLLYVNLPRLTRIPDQMTIATIKFMSLGSREYPVTHIGLNNGYLGNCTQCVITTESGTSDGVTIETETTKYYFTAMNSKWVKTEKELYCALDDDKAILAELYDKNITSYNFTNIGDVNRTAYGKIHNDFFRNCVNLNDVILPDGVTELGSYCFSNCKRLTNFSLSNTVKIIGDYCFEGLPVKVFDCKNVSTVAYAAFWNTGIEIMNMPAVTKLRDTVINGGVRFFSIGSEDHPVVSFDTRSNVIGRCCIITTADGRALEGVNQDVIHYTNKGYKWVKTDKEVYALSNTDNKKAILGECLDKKITTYDLNNINNAGIQAYELLGYECFYNCGELVEINIPDGVTSMGTACFQNCRKLVRVGLPENIITLPTRCFDTCTSLREIRIPNSVEVIGDSCFWSTALTEINIGTNIRKIYYHGLGNIYPPTSARIAGPVALGGEVFGSKSFQDGITLGSAGHPVQSFESTTFRNLSNTRVTIYTSSGDNTSLPGSPWGAASNVTFVYERA